MAVAIGFFLCVSFSVEGQTNADGSSADELYNFVVREHSYLLLNTLVTPENAPFLKFLDKIAVVNRPVLDAILENNRFYLFTQGETPAELIASLANNNISEDELMQMHNVEAWCALTPQTSANGTSGLSSQLGCDVKGPNILGAADNPFRAFMSGSCPGGGGGSAGSAASGTQGVGGDCGPASSSAAQDMANIASAGTQHKRNEAENRLKDSVCGTDDSNVSVNYVNPAQARLQQTSDEPVANDGVPGTSSKGAAGGSGMGGTTSVPLNKPGSFFERFFEKIREAQNDKPPATTPKSPTKNPGERDTGGMTSFTRPNDPTYDPMGDMAWGALQLFAVNRHVSAGIGGAIDPSPEGNGVGAGQVVFDPCNGKMSGGGMMRLTMSDIQQNAMAGPCSRSNPGETGANNCVGGSSPMLNGFFRSLFCKNNSGSPLCKGSETRVGVGPPKSRGAEQAKQAQQTAAGMKESKKIGSGAQSGRRLQTTGGTNPATLQGSVQQRTPATAVPASGRSVWQQKTPASVQQRGSPAWPGKK